MTVFFKNIILIICFFFCTTAFADTIIWNGGNGNWNDAAKWNTGVPTANDDIIIDNNIANSSVNMNVSATVGSLVLREGDQLNVASTRTLTINDGPVDNGGVILLNQTSTSGVTDLQIIGNVAFNGDGEVKLGSGPSTVDDRNRIFGSTNAQRLINGENHTFSGGGQFGVNQLRLTNEGIISANDTNDSMVIDLAGSDNFNTGTIQAISNSTLTISGSNINNTAGLVQANNGNININSSTLSSGNINNDGGSITLNSSTINNNGTANIQNGNLNLNSSTIQDSTTNIASGASLNLNASNINSGIINNNGTTTITGSSVLRNGNLNNEGQLTVNNRQTLTLENGTFNNDGVILLNQTSTSGVTDLQVIGNVTLSGNGELKLGSGPSTVDDSNRILGSTNAQRLTNGSDHTISGGGQLGVNQIRLTNQGTISANDTNDSMVIDLSGNDNFNSGTIQAVSNATLTISGSNFNNNDGLVQANDGNININSSNIAQGQITADNDGRITLNSSSINTGANIDVTRGTLNLNSSTVEDSTTNIANGSAVNLNASSINNGIINNSGTITVTGSSILRNGNLNNEGQFTINNAQTLTLENGTFNNDGIILLNQTSTSGVTDLQVVGNVTLSGNGELRLGNGPSTVDDRNRIFGSTNAQRLTNGSNHTISGGGQLGVNQIRLTNQGTISANDTNDSMVIDLAGSDNFNSGTIRAISGSTLTISGSNFNNAGGLVQADNGNININSSNISQGRINSINNGLIALNSSVINTGAVLSVSSGTLNLNSSTIQDSTTNVANGASLNLNASSVNSGIINNDGTVTVTGSSTLRNGNLNNRGQFTLNNRQTLTLENGTFKNDGVILLNQTSTSGTTDLQIIGDVTLSGNGELKLGNGPSTIDDRNRIFGSTNAQRLINDKNHTISGGGQLGVNQIRLTNIGTINANDTNDSMIIDLSGSDNLNRGTIKSTQGSTLTVSGTALDNSTGLIQADNSTININSSTITGGNQQIDGASGRITLNSSTINGPSRISVNNGSLNANSSSINGSIVEVANDGRFNVNSSIVDGTNNGGKIKNRGTVEVTGASIFRNSSLENDGQVTISNRSTLTLENGVFQNDGSILLNQTSTSGVTDLQITGTVNLTGKGKLELGTKGSTVDDRNRVFGSTNAQRLVQGADHSIEGGGQLGVNQLRLTNRGDIVGNDQNDTLVIDLSGSDNINAGNIHSTSGGSVTIVGTTIINSENSTRGTISTQGGTTSIVSSTITGGGDLMATQGGLLSISSSNISVDSIAMDNSRISIVSSNVSLAEGFAYETNSSGNFNLNTANLTFTGGAGASIGDWDEWSYIEVGGRDLNNDNDGSPSSTQLAGNSAGFTNNFDLQQLEIDISSQVFLMDRFNNQSGLEALYVDTLILGAGSTLYLNGINLYFANIINRGGTIISDDLGLASLTNFAIPSLVDNPTIDPLLPADPVVAPPSSQVPEPATWLSIIVALCCILIFKSRNEKLVIST